MHKIDYLFLVIKVGEVNKNNWILIEALSRRRENPDHIAVVILRKEDAMKNYTKNVESYMKDLFPEVSIRDIRLAGNNFPGILSQVVVFKREEEDGKGEGGGKEVVIAVENGKKIIYHKEKFYLSEEDKWELLRDIDFSIEHDVGMLKSKIEELEKEIFLKKYILQGENEQS